MHQKAILLVLGANQYAVGYSLVAAPGKIRFRTVHSQAWTFPIVLFVDRKTHSSFHFSLEHSIFSIVPFRKNPVSNWSRRGLNLSNHSFHRLWAHNPFQCYTWSNSRFQFKVWLPRVAQSLKAPKPNGGVRLQFPSTPRAKMQCGFIHGPGIMAQQLCRLGAVCPSSLSHWARNLRNGFSERKPGCGSHLPQEVR